MRVTQELIWSNSKCHTEAVDDCMVFSSCYSPLPEVWHLAHSCFWGAQVFQLELFPAFLVTEKKWSEKCDSEVQLESFCLTRGINVLLELLEGSDTTTVWLQANMEGVGSQSSSYDLSKSAHPPSSSFLIVFTALEMWTLVHKLNFKAKCKHTRSLQRSGFLFCKKLGKLVRLTNCLQFAVQSLICNLLGISAEENRILAAWGWSSPS